MSGAASFHEEEELGRAADLRLLRRLWAFVAPYRGQVVLTVAMVAPIFLLELAPAWIVKTGLDRVIAPQATGEAAEGEPGLLAPILEPPAGVSPLFWLAGLYLGAMAGFAALQYGQRVLMARTGQAAMRDLRGHIFRHIERLHMGFFDRYPVGRLVTRGSNDVEHVAEAFSQGIVAIFTDLIKMVGFAVALFLVDAKLALVTFAVVPFLAVAAVVFRLKVRAAYRTTRVYLARLNATIQETITGMKVVQLFAREERNQRDFDGLNARHRDAWLQSIRYDAALFSVVELAQYLTVAIAIWFGMGLASAGVLYVFIDWTRRFFMPLRDLSAKFSVMQSSMASLERIVQFLDTAPAVGEPERPRAPEPRREGAGEVEFEKVWFAYPGGDWALRDVSFRVAPGEKVAFVGATGAGKTTVIKLLTRLYEPSHGTIRLDGVDLREIPQRALRQRVATVLQDVFLFSGSVEENIGLGREDVSSEAVRDAARAAHADGFIRRLPQGYATEVHERGSNLSAGQRQLLAFARALAHGGDVLVLDEATSSIDPETEAEVQRGIHALLQGRTALVIAHRLSTIEDVDRIHVMHHGRIHETGAHAELLARGGLYHRLHRLQNEAPAATAPAAAGR